MIIDADTTIDRDLLGYFDNDLRGGSDWIQCYYSVANADQSMRTRLMTYAFSLYNGVLLKGLNALGLSVGFKGNGMCFSTRGLKRIPWRAYGLVEDMEYSWTCVRPARRSSSSPGIGLWRNGPYRRRGRGPPAPAMGIWPQADDKAISGTVSPRTQFAVA